jgi:hypothetical protein
MNCETLLACITDKRRVAAVADLKFTTVQILCQRQASAVLKTMFQRRDVSYGLFHYGGGSPSFPETQ